MSLLPVSEAQARLLEKAAVLEDENTALTEAVHRWTTRDISARRTQPAADLSAMDGYAVRHADMPGPWQVAGESAAGGSYGRAVQPGEAVRIYTGATVPDGADTVVIQEDVSRDGDILTLGEDALTPKGRNIRRAGSDFSEGQAIIPAGSRLTARHVALAALAGHGAIPLSRPPRIAILSTGSELVEPGEPIGPNQIPASNGVMLSAMLADLPCTVTDMGVIKDDLAALTGALTSVADHDLIISTGGASVGDHDLVKPALEAAGGSIDFWKIRMRPGKPLIAGKLGSALFLGLPGNPVSAYVTATLFMLPVVRKMLGCPAPLPMTMMAKLGADMPAVSIRDDYVRAVLEDGIARPVVSQDSAATYALSLANCLIRRVAGSPATRAGEEAELVLLDT